MNYLVKLILCFSLSSQYVFSHLAFAKGPQKSTSASAASIKNAIDELQQSKTIGSYLTKIETRIGKPHADFLKNQILGKESTKLTIENRGEEGYLFIHEKSLVPVKFVIDKSNILTITVNHRQIAYDADKSIEDFFVQVKRALPNSSADPNGKKSALLWLNLFQPAHAIIDGVSGAIVAVGIAGLVAGLYASSCKIYRDRLSVCMDPETSNRKLQDEARSALTAGAAICFHEVNRFRNCMRDQYAQRKMIIPLDMTRYLNPPRMQYRDESPSNADGSTNQQQPEAATR